jgi:glycosyltransferase 2 family protein
MEEVERKVSLREKLFDIKTLLSFALSFGILYLFLTRIDLGAAWKVMKGANPLLYLFAFTMYYAAYPVRGLRWKRLLENTGFALGTGDSTEILFISWFANCLVPAKLGDIYRGYLLKKNFAVSMSKAIGTIFVERTFDIVTLVVLLSLSGILSFEGRLPGTVTNALRVGLLLSVVLIVILGGLRYFRDFIARFLPHRFSDIFIRFEEGVTHSLVARTTPVLTIYTVIIWAFEVGTLYLVTRAISLNVALPIVIFVALAASLLTSIPITPAGLGAVELAITGLLILVSVPPDVSVSVALLYRIVSYWSLIAIGGIVFVVSKKTKQ